MTFSVFTISMKAQFAPGSTYLDQNNFVEYRAVNLPIILSAPHGGGLEPDSIPDRDCVGCVTTRDSYTKSITEGLYDAIVKETGCYPHVIINLLHRKKFDANRGIEDAADGNLDVEDSWQDYHAFIDSAKAQVVKDYGRGIFLDIHGHAHTFQRIELGYLLSGAELREADNVLDSPEYIEESSIRTLADDNIENYSHAELLRGEESLGSLLDNKGFPAVPSFSDHFPADGEPYFSGGYNTGRHGSRDNVGEIDAVQVELNQAIRFNDSTRIVLIDSLAEVINQYVDLHYFQEYAGAYCDLISHVHTPESKEMIKLLPNPTKDFIQFETDYEVLNVEIYDLLGDMVLQKKWSGGVIDVGDLSAGSYFVLLKTNAQSKIILKMMIPTF